ncbi:FKBP-type peptidyl-prolyl cis-trans isomerase [Cyclobacterium plantarum]|uniref:FKBP-type peptidyl-prolyl cis-trans isomerase n=1 Tax=Cyclobacterium plantarum TaxID=2716263 RepID=UPI003F70D205
MNKNPNMSSSFLILLFISITTLSCNSNKKVHDDDFIQTPSGLKYRILKEGNGESAKEGQEVLIHETMSYMNDSLLFDSRTLPNPVKILIGGGQAIAGVDEALVGMKKEEIKKLIVPPKLSKRTGKHTFPNPDSTLLYRVELIDILELKNLPEAVYFSSNNGENWINKNNGLPESTTISSIATNENTIGILSKANGVYTFDFQNDSWKSIKTDKIIIENNPTRIALFKNNIYLGTQFGGVYYTKDKGEHWERINEGLDNLTIRRFQNIGNKLFVCTNAGLFSLSANNTTWENEFASDNMQVNGITIFDGNTYIGTTQGVFTSPIGKKNWKNVLSNYTLHNISADDKHIYAMTYNELLFSTDKGATWQSLQKGLPKELYTFNVIKNGNFVFAGQWDGIYRKNSDYETWQAYSNGLPSNLSITNMKLFKGTIVVSGNERELRKGMTTNK